MLCNRLEFPTFIHGWGNGLLAPERPFPNDAAAIPKHQYGDSRAYTKNQY